MGLQFSNDLQKILEKEREQPLSLGDVLAETSERGFFLMLSLLALPFLFPMPPGMTTVFGSVCLFLSGQIVLGNQTPWLPRRTANFQLPKAFAIQLLNNLGRIAKLLEKVTRPRWPRFSRHPSVLRINGLCIIWLTLLLMLPIPFTNPVPASGILLLSISTLEEDGLLMFVGYFVVGLSTALFGALGYILWRSPNILQQVFSFAAGQ